MSFSFYPKLAIDGIRKNKRLYLPYILTCIGMIMMTYIMNYLEFSDAIKMLPGGATIQEIMKFGVFVIIVFAVIFLFYTNSFLTRRRKKEFGLYNILGMNKKNLNKIILWESVFVAMISLALGLTFGIALSKLVELGFCNMMKGDITYSYEISGSAVLFTAIPFVMIFFLIFLNSIRQVWFSKTISLLRSENTGEKPPKANWFLGLLGAGILAGAYYISVTIKDPISAIGMFFVAVVMVIISTYMLMIAGSVVICRILQKNKNYYYQKNHFVSVSSMVYRMKRNGAGLASICILATMVLVMISSTSALFIGSEDVIKNRYPREINCWFHTFNGTTLPDSEMEVIKNIIDDVLENHNAEKENIMDYRCVSTSGLLNDGEVIYDTNDVNNFNIGTFSDVHQIYAVSIDDYNKMMNTDIRLNDDEVLIYASRDTFSGEKFSFKGHKQYKVKEIVKECFLSSDIAVDVVPSIMIIANDIDEITQGLISSDGNDLTYRKWYYDFDTKLSAEENIEIHNEMIENLSAEIAESNVFGCCIESRDYERKDFYSLYGGLFYLGVILSIVFIFAAVLIIYYKQISEGYEDMSRFEIMQKVGMTKKDIRHSINSQLLTVFFLPLVTAGLHLAFAFPIVEKILLCFNLNNRPLFIGTTICSFLVFALFYGIVYRMTSNAYYNIVSGAKGKE